MVSFEILLLTVIVVRCFCNPQARIDAGEDVVVGVNKYRIPEGQAEAVDVLRIDNTPVLKSQIEGIQRSKAGRDEAKVQACLAKLTASAALSAEDGNNDKVCVCIFDLCQLCEIRLHFLKGFDHVATAVLTIFNFGF